MDTGKRITLNCWHCERDYTLFKHLNVGEQPMLYVACPFCGRQGVVDLAPYRSDLIEVLRSHDEEAQSLGETLDLPEVLPTRKPEA